MPIAAERGFSFADPYAIGVLFVGLTLFAAVVALTKEHERAFTSAVVYLTLGAVGALLVDLVGVRLLDPHEDAVVIERLAEFAVIVALFGAGLKIERPVGWPEWRSPAVLLALVMPITIGAVALFASGVMGLSLGAAVLLGAVLAPTDPVLASDVQVGPPGDEEEAEPHFALTAEAGLNDGLAFPFVFLGLFIAAEGGSDWLGEWLLADVLYAIPAGIAIGAVGGRLIARLSLVLRDRELMDVRFDGWVSIAAVLAVYGLTEMVGAYGFLAAFAAGLSFRRYERHHELHARTHAGAEVVEHFSELALVLVLGSTLTLSGLSEPGLGGWLLVPVLLLLIRPLSTLVSFAGSSLAPRERLFVGWFGIRGIGSFYYVAVALGAGVLPSGESAVVYWTVFVCVGASIVAHGISSSPLTRWLERSASRA